MLPNLTRDHRSQERDRLFLFLFVLVFPFLFLTWQGHPSVAAAAKPYSSSACHVLVVYIADNPYDVSIATAFSNFLSSSASPYNSQGTYAGYGFNFTVDMVGVSGTWNIAQGGGNPFTYQTGKGVSGLAPMAVDPQDYSAVFDLRLMNCYSLGQGPNCIAIPPNVGPDGLTAADVATYSSYVSQGGGLFVLGNNYWDQGGGSTLTYVDREQNMYRLIDSIASNGIGPNSDNIQVGAASDLDTVTTGNPYNINTIDYPIAGLAFNTGYPGPLVIPGSGLPFIMGSVPNSGYAGPDNLAVLWGPTEMQSGFNGKFIYWGDETAFYDWATNNLPSTPANQQTSLTQILANMVSVLDSGTYCSPPPNDNTQVAAYIYNSAGELVKTLTTVAFNSPVNNISLAPGNTITAYQGAGSFVQFFYNGSLLGTWDGTNNQGNPVSNGTYKLQVQSTGSQNTFTNIVQSIVVNRGISSVQVDIYDAAGEVVKQLYNVSNNSMNSNMLNVNLSSQAFRPNNLANGNNGSAVTISVQDTNQTTTVVWDGTNNAGTNVTPGDYEMTVHWTNGNNDTTNVTRTILVLSALGPTGQVLAKPNIIRPPQSSTLFDASSVSGASSLKVRLYTISGELVAVLESVPGNPTVAWTPSTASGVYIASAEVTNASGGLIQRAFLKVLVMH